MNRDEATPLERYLAGELDRADLPPELRHDEDRLAELLATQVRADARAPAELRAAVLREIAGPASDAATRVPSSVASTPPREGGWLAAVTAWLTRPRTVRYTPASAGAALAAAALAAVLLLPAGEVPDAGADGTPSDTPVAENGGPSGATSAVPAAAPGGATEAGTVVTRFVFVAPEAASVTLAGDWTGWDADRIPLRQLRDTGVWTVDVPVPPGVHEYAFVVDGTEWRPDPLAGSQVDDGFGRTNSVLLVSGAEA